MARLRLADDHPIVRRGLRRFLDDCEDLEVIGEHEDGHALLAGCKEDRPDVVVMDLNMPGVDGLGGFQRFLGKLGPTPVVVFSMHDEDHYALGVLKAGAAAYLSKGRGPEEVAVAIRAVLREGRYLTPTLAARLLEPSDQAPHEQLSGREREVFVAFANGHSPQTIGEQLNIKASTVHSYLERVRIKLGVANTQQVIRYAFKHGITS